MSTNDLFTRLKKFFSQKPASNPSRMVSIVDEQTLIATIRAHMAHLAHLTTSHYANYLVQWKAYIDDIDAETESIVFMSAAKRNETLKEESVRVWCKVLMQFSKHDNFCLDNGIALSSEWNILRQEIIAHPSV